VSPEAGAVQKITSDTNFATPVEQIVSEVKPLRSHEEMALLGKSPYEEEAVVNILSTASLNTQMTLLERAHNLQAGLGLDSRRKEDWQRKRLALSLYENVFMQFPDGPKAPEAGYRAAWIYYGLGELYRARDLCLKIISDYSFSPYAYKAKRLYAVIDHQLENKARQKFQSSSLEEEGQESLVESENESSLEPTKNFTP
jgi:hypothetical protein